jgi:hypothetical protein
MMKNKEDDLKEKNNAKAKSGTSKPRKAKAIIDVKEEEEDVYIKYQKYLEKKRMENELKLQTSRKKTQGSQYSATTKKEYSLQIQDLRALSKELIINKKIGYEHHSYLM